MIGVEIDEATSGDGDAVRVAPEIGENLGGANSRRKSLASGLTARKKSGRPLIQRVPSGERPPAGTTR